MYRGSTATVINIVYIFYFLCYPNLSQHILQLKLHTFNYCVTLCKPKAYNSISITQELLENKSRVEYFLYYSLPFAVFLALSTEKISYLLFCTVRYTWSCL